MKNNPRLEKQIERNRKKCNAKKRINALRRKSKAARRWNRKANGNQKHAQRWQERKYPSTMFMRFVCKKKQCPLDINDCTNCIIDRVITVFGKEYRIYNNDNTTSIIR